jgi:hypothetical protein
VEFRSEFIPPRRLRSDARSVVSVVDRAVPLTGRAVLSHVEALTADIIDSGEVIDRSGLVRHPLPPQFQSASHQ